MTDTPRTPSASSASATSVAADSRDADGHDTNVRDTDAGLEPSRSTEDNPGLAVSTAEAAAGRTGRGPARFLGIVAFVIAFVVLASMPFGLAVYPIKILTQALLYGLFAASLDLLVGYTGLPSLGHGAYFGIGAYAAGLFANHVTSVAPLQAVVGMAVGAALAALAGLLAVRMRGTYFLMFTLAVSEVVHVAVDKLEVTGGSNGLNLKGTPQLLPGFDIDNVAFMYWYVLVVVALAMIALVVIVRSPFGRSLVGVRENENRMAAIGYAVPRHKFGAFVLAGAFAGLAGSLLAAQSQYVSPTNAGFAASALALVMLILGGSRTLFGAFAGSTVYVLVRDLVAPALGAATTGMPPLLHELAGRAELLLGLLFILVVYLLPKGIVGTAIELVTGRKRPVPTAEVEVGS